MILAELHLALLGVGLDDLWSRLCTPKELDELFEDLAKIRYNPTPDAKPPTKPTGIIAEYGPDVRITREASGFSWQWLIVQTLQHSGCWVDRKRLETSKEFAWTEAHAEACKWQIELDLRHNRKTTLGKGGELLRE